jgi:hypothetical protein
VKTAIEQLSATLDNKTVKTPLEQYEKRAYAVVTNIPTPSTDIQNKQDEFKRHKQCTLKVVKSSHVYDFISGEPIT